MRYQAVAYIGLRSRTIAGGQVYRSAGLEHSMRIGNSQRTKLLWAPRGVELTSFSSPEVQIAGKLRTEGAERASNCLSGLSHLADSVIGHATLVACAVGPASMLEVIVAGKPNHGSLIVLRGCLGRTPIFLVQLTFA